VRTCNLVGQTPVQEKKGFIKITKFIRVVKDGLKREVRVKFNRTKD